MLWFSSEDVRGLRKAKVKLTVKPIFSWFPNHNIVFRTPHPAFQAISPSVRNLTIRIRCREKFPNLPMVMVISVLGIAYCQVRNMSV